MAVFFPAIPDVIKWHELAEEIYAVKWNSPSGNSWTLAENISWKEVIEFFQEVPPEDNQLTIEMWQDGQWKPCQESEWDYEQHRPSGIYPAVYYPGTGEGTFR